MSRTVSAMALLGTLALGACAVAPPTGPTVMALPAKGKSFAEFQQDDASCQQYALAQIGYASPAQAASQSGLSTAAIGTAVGAAAGAVLGAAAGNPALGTAIGAGSGLLFGGAAGIGNAQASGASLQARYNMRYIQCMAAKGESVPSPASGYADYYPYGTYPAYPGYYYPAYP